MKKLISTLLIVGLSSCTSNANHSLHPREVVVEKETTSSFKRKRSCDIKFIDILQLKAPLVEKQFFKFLDSSIRIQYQRNNGNFGLNQDISINLLRNFLNDLEQEACLDQNVYVANYRFQLPSRIFRNKAGNSQSIIVRYYPELCNFRIILNSSFWSKDFGAEVSRVTYEFAIQEGEIENFSRFNIW